MLTVFFFVEENIEKRRKRKILKDFSSLSSRLKNFNTAKRFDITVDKN